MKKNKPAKPAAPAQQDVAAQLGLRPGQSLELLKALHILTREGKLNQDSRRKLKQVYHLYQFIEPLLAELSADGHAPLLADHGVKVDAARAAELERKLTHLMPFRQGLERAFPFPTDWAAKAPDALVVCRCENITAGELRACARDAGADEMNRLKALTRVGMGRCQGRMCGVAAAEILAQATGKPIEAVGRLRGQAPIKPIPIHLQAQAEAAE